MKNSGGFGPGCHSLRAFGAMSEFLLYFFVELLQFFRVCLEDAHEGV